MKTYVELGLAALLAVLVYEKPTFLIKMTNSTLGILIMIVSVGVIAKQFGINAGLLASIILILLLESRREGMIDVGCNIKAWNKGKTPGGCALNMPSTVSLKNIPIGGFCAQDKDCLPGKKTCKITKNASGQPKKCATKSQCTEGRCEVICQHGECPDDKGGALTASESAILTADKIHQAGSDEQFVGGMQEGYTNIRIPLQPHSFPVTGTDQITIDRTFKLNALHAKNAASQQANGCTNNGGGIAF